MVDEQIVYDTTIRAAQKCVPGEPNGELTHIGGGDVLQKCERVLAFDPKFTHVTHIEDAGPFTHRAVFVDDAGVLDRHIPTAELDHTGIEGQVLRVEYRP